MRTVGHRFFRRVYALVREIPRGRVATYGQIAAMLNVPRGARAVGWALRALPADEEARVPWHRVVGAGGRISPRPGPGPQVQRRLLAAEGVAFRRGQVNLAGHGLLVAGRAQRYSIDTRGSRSASRARWRKRRVAASSKA
jgi:methylated-DNA-protein-cysteine methyltransferase-like protein